MRVQVQKELTPEKFVKSQPLPIPSHKGIQIQARSDVVYNATIPTRDLVRKENYDRRQVQLNHQGFHAANFRPYQGIGDPFYLSEKRLILHALGQWDENQEDESSSSSDSSDDEEKLNNLQNQQQNSVTPANFVLRRARKDLNTLPKEVTHGRDMIRNVRLGHGLFQILRKERQAKTEAKQQELRLKRERLRTEWQPPKDSSSDESTDEDEIDIRSLSVDLSGRERLDSVPSTMAVADGSIDQDTVAPSEDQTERNVVVKVDDTRSVRSGRSSRKRQQNARPFTPGHSNIASEDNRVPDKHALFRQLCCLYWLLEAMNIDPPVVMAPITTCWNFKEVGGARTTPAKGNKDRMEQRWKNFSTDLRLKLAEEQEKLRELLQVQQLIGRDQDKHTLMTILKKVDMETVEELYAAVQQIHLTMQGLRQKILHEQQPDFGDNMSCVSERKRSFYKRKSSARLSHVWHVENAGRRRGHLKPSRRTSGNLRSSLTASPAGSMTRLQTSSPSTLRKDLTIPEDSELGEVSDLNGEDDIEKSLLLDDIPTARSQNIDDRNSVLEIASIRSEMSFAPPTRKGSSRDRPDIVALRRPTASAKTDAMSSIQQRSQSPQMTKAQILEAITRHDEDPRLAKLIYIQEKRTSTKMRAEKNLRPRSSAALIEHVANLPSNKLTQMPQTMRQKFSEVGQEKALVLHDILEAVERERMRKMQKKFTKMTSSRSVHRALSVMRANSDPFEEASRSKQRASRIYQQWFLDLDHAIPEEVKQDWYFSKILSKLSKYGLVEANKQSTYKFLKVLTGLRDWEVCSPDVCAAIEFCRAKIVEMSVEEYEDFFCQQFPTVPRPQTAPPGAKPQKSETKTSTDVSRGRVVVKSQSAPAGGRQRQT